MLRSYLWGKVQTTCIPAFTNTHTLLKTYVPGTTYQCIYDSSISFTYYNDSIPSVNNYLVYLFWEKYFNNYVECVYLRKIFVFSCNESRLKHKMIKVFAWMITEFQIHATSFLFFWLKIIGVTLVNEIIDFKCTSQ